MNFSLAYTSARPGAIQQIVDLWNRRAVNPKEIEWVIATDHGHDACRTVAEQVSASSHVPIKLVENSGARTCVAGWNAAASATSGKVIIGVSDDFVPPEGWDQKLLALKPEGWIDGEYVVHVEDGYVHDIFVLAILTRKRYDRFGYLFFPDYESVFCDTEFTETAHRDGVVIEAMHLLFEHCHPDCYKRQRDAVDLVHSSSARWKRGEMLFNFRKSHGFPREGDPQSTTEVKTEPTRKYCAYLQVTRDDFCLAETCIRLHEEGVHDFFFAVPDEYWDGRKVPEEDLASLKGVVAELSKHGITVNLKVFRVATYRFSGDTRIDTETRLRNDSLAWIRSNGFSHILIVDGDELWMRGTLDRVDALVAQGVMVVSTRMVPVIGLPGYPVHRASDLAVVYVGGNCQFKGCRTPFMPQTVIQLPCIIHFTGTRKTMEEIIAKHRTSGHYDDPDYDFETWIEQVLPNIRPGFVYEWPGGHKGLHMYLKGQIWPEVRNWTQEEIREIPESLGKYLGQ